VLCVKAATQSCSLDPAAQAGVGEAHIALSLIRLNTSVKTSIKTKRLLAATSDEFRAALLGFAVDVGDDDEVDD
jgi:hypothetical protein